jgi:2,3-bisphosphoglycerate-dependent phosphoglycerate mutase
MTYSLILLRHGESTWNLENIFTGWTDVGLSDRGLSEAVAAGGMMNDANIEIDVVHTSLQTRAIMTANLSLDAMDAAWVPVRRSWRLNERHYGALQGLNKKETSDRYGKEQVHEWRRSYTVRPPALELSDPRSPSHDRRYSDLAPELIPEAECLADVVERMLPYWYDSIVPDLRDGRTVLVAAHGNSLRALVKHLDGIPDDEISELNIPTGIPLRYELDANLEVLSQSYLGDAEAAAVAAAKVAAQAG